MIQLSFLLPRNRSYKIDLCGELEALPLDSKRARTVVRFTAQIINCINQWFQIMFRCRCCQLSFIQLFQTFPCGTRHNVSCFVLLVVPTRYYGNQGLARTDSATCASCNILLSITTRRNHRLGIDRLSEFTLLELIVYCLQLTPPDVSPHRPRQELSTAPPKENRVVRHARQSRVSAPAKVELSVHRTRQSRVSEAKSK